MYTAFVQNTMPGASKGKQHQYVHSHLMVWLLQATASAKYFGEIT